MKYCLPVAPPPSPPGAQPSLSAPETSMPPPQSASIEEPVSETVSSEAGPETASPPAVRPDGSSAYARSTLPSASQAAYDALVEGLMNRREKIPLSLPGEAALSQALLCVRRDYPVLSWLDSRYSYETNADNSISCIYPRYTKTAAEIAGETARIEAAAETLLQNIDPGLSEFDRALIVYDRLCGRVVYDLEAPNASELYGALCDGRATCDGYAKAYQYLLSRLGIETLVVYGVAEEPHAWNIVRLDGTYYQADPTWGDTMIPGGGVFLSHAYLFLDDEIFSRSHSPYGGEHNIPLPSCGSMAQNYFAVKGTVLEEASAKALRQALSDALDVSMANGYEAVQIRFADEELAAECTARFVDSGEADRLMQERASARGKRAVGRSYAEDVGVLTYLLE